MSTAPERGDTRPLILSSHSVPLSLRAWVAPSVDNSKLMVLSAMLVLPYPPLLDYTFSRCSIGFSPTLPSRAVDKSSILLYSLYR